VSALRLANYLPPRAWLNKP